MVTEWITAIATSSAAIVGIITVGMSVRKVRLKKRKDREEVLRKLKRYIYWLNKTDVLLKNIFASSNNNLTTEEVVKRHSMYIPNGAPVISELEKINDKTGYGLSKDDENQIENFCKLLIGFINLYDYLKESVFDESKKQILFKVMKSQLKEKCPKEMLYDLEKTEDSEFSEYIFAYIFKLRKKWEEVERILGAH